MKNLIKIIILASFLTSCSSIKAPTLTFNVNEPCTIYSLKSAECKTKKELIKELRDYKVIFIGDHHDSIDLHQDVASIINAISKDGYKVILANEWFTPAQNTTLHKFVNSDINESMFVKEINWSKKLRYSYNSFKPIYDTVKKNNGKLKGINLSKNERKKISSLKLKQMSKEELNFYNSLDLNVSTHKQMISPYISHCHAPLKGESLEECTLRMYRVQVAWDSKMADESYKLYKKLKKDEKLIVFAGSMHIINRLGIPLRFARYTSTPTITIIPAQKEKNITIPLGTSDYILIY